LLDIRHDSKQQGNVLKKGHAPAQGHCADVRLQPVASEVKPKEASLGLRDMSGMSKAQAIAATRNTLQTGAFTPREAAALKLVDRIVVDPHTVDDNLFAELPVQRRLKLF
jgi:hypothetical protein